ncbi:MAG: hypothetical protein FD123_3475 [Bacteroidetes bacterium]|nr:MAG: hypothetical protein FD123_3475 [Bacteroidota bacterium]
MRKIYILLSAAVISTGILSAQQAVTPNAPETAPGINSGNQNPTPQTPWQVIFNYDITAAGSGTGNAGVVLIGNEFWVSRWGTDTISNYTLAGSFISKFVVAGVTGTRSMTTDGTDVYAGTNATSIYKINPVTKTLTSTITVSGVANVRYCTYDPTLPGFWVGTWATDFTQVDMNGQPQSVVAAGTHLLAACYGLAYDNTSPGGPYLWAFNQTGTNNAADIIQVNIATGMQTGVIHDVTSDFGVAGDLAGGVHIVSSPLGLVGVLQGAANYLFSYDITGVNGMSDNISTTDFISAYPNPSNDMVNIHVNRVNNDPMQIQVMDITGKVVYQSNSVGMNNYLSMAKYDAGIYTVKVTYNNQSYTTKVVKN